MNDSIPRGENGQIKKQNDLEAFLLGKRGCLRGNAGKFEEKKGY